MNQNRESLEYWHRAVRTFRTAMSIADDNDSVVNRCYYSAFHAVSALFAFDGKTFQTHAGIQAAVHRDLVNAGKWPKELGAGYSFLLKTRMMADYGGSRHVMEDEAKRALEAAEHILNKVHVSHPEVFSMDA